VRKSFLVYAHNRIFLKRKGGCKMKKAKLTLDNFTRNHDYNYLYYYYKDSKGFPRELCIEPCLSGFCIGIYNSKQLLIKPKVCTNLDPLISNHKTIIERALEIANKMIEE